MPDVFSFARNSFAPKYCFSWIAHLLLMSKENYLSFNWFFSADAIGQPMTLLKYFQFQCILICNKINMQCRFVIKSPTFILLTFVLTIEYHMFQENRNADFISSLWQMLLSAEMKHYLWYPTKDLIKNNRLSDVCISFDNKDHLFRYKQVMPTNGNMI